MWNLLSDQTEYSFENECFIRNICHQQKSEKQYILCITKPHKNSEFLIMDQMAKTECNNVRL